LVVKFPFEERYDGSTRVRTFSSETDVEELVWHRDEEDRVVRVVESDGWYFQRDGELPQPMKTGDVIHVARNEWHRVIMRKSTKLVVEIDTY
jgi:quercetin dioxygenase-like cupin family protein